MNLILPGIPTTGLKADEVTRNSGPDQRSRWTEMQPAGVLRRGLPDALSSSDRHRAAVCQARPGAHNEAGLPLRNMTPTVRLHRKLSTRKVVGTLQGGP